MLKNPEEDAQVLRNWLNEKINPVAQKRLCLSKKFDLMESVIYPQMQKEGLGASITLVMLDQS